MSLDPITAGIDLLDDAINKIWPDKSAQEKAAIALAAQQDNNYYQLLLAQAQTNTAEAASPSMFVAGWRPAVGWICAASFAWSFVLQPILVFISVALNHPIALPAFDVATMTTVLMGMLGLGSLRTIEKTQGVARK